MSGASEMQLLIGQPTAAGQAYVRLLYGQKVVFGDLISLRSAKARRAFLDECRKRAPGLEREQLDHFDQELDRAASDDEAVSAAKASDQLAQHQEMFDRDSESDAALGPLPTIVVNTRQHRHVIRDGWQACIARGTPSMPAVFERDGFAVIVVRRHGHLTIKLFTDSVMAAHLASVANWLRETRNGLVPVPPPARVASDMVEIPDSTLQPLHAILTTPVYGASGTLLIEPGYYPSDRVILHEPLPVHPVPNTPTAQDLAEARAVLDDLLHDFPFVTPSDQAHAIGTAVALAARGLIRGPIPLHDFESPTPGSGKNLLVLALAMAFIDGGLPAHPFPTGDAEARKLITSILMDSPAAVLLDNARQGSVIDSPKLAALLTAPRWSDRVLGVSRIVDLPNAAVWIMTGNNPRFSLELARRSVRIRLDSRTDRPWQRSDFRHPDLPAWAQQHRPDIAHAVFVLVQNWLAHGRPAGMRQLGSFEAWSKVVGGIVTAAGYAGFLDHADAIYELADAESTAWEEFTSAWWSEHGNTPQSVSALVKFCVAHSLLGDVLENGSERSQATRLGSALATQRDRSYAGLRIEMAADKGHKGKRYRLVQLAAPGGESGNGKGTFSANGSPPPILAGSRTCVDWGTSGDLERASRQSGVRCEEAIAVPEDDDNSRPLSTEGSPGSPAAGNLAFATDWDGEPPRFEVPRAAKGFGGHAPVRTGVLVGHRALVRITDPELGDVCCAAGPWEPGS